MTRRALVLGGGGATGIAWEWGVLAGLAEAGIDVAATDLLVGTSAGSIVAAQLTSGRDLDVLYADQLTDADEQPAPKLSTITIMRLAVALLRSWREDAYRRRVGRLALGVRTDSEAHRRAMITRRLPVHEWPAQRLLITACDADTGKFVVFDRDSGVPLVDAVGASCAVPGVWPPVTINGRRYIDGGMRSTANADLASRADRILVVAPDGRGAGPIAKLSDQVAALRRTATVVVITPDRPARTAIGRRVLDPARRASAARAGRAQAASDAAEVAGKW